MGERDYLEEAFAIIKGESLLLAQKEHLIVLQDYYVNQIRITREYCKLLLSN